MNHNDPLPDGASTGDDSAADRLLALYLDHDLDELPTAECDETGTSEIEVPNRHRPGDTIGSYTLLEHLADGGMGEVWKAERQEPFHLKVALKIIKVGMDTREVVARFEAERKALALMDHPHIARVFDGGATAAGRPFFVMELVDGLPITTYCDKTRLPTRDRLFLFIKVCEAVQHAHQRGIIHRDLKPGNILVTTHDDKPFPKVIDFGIAKATSQELTVRTLVAEYGCIVGTLAYMSPEQAQFTNDDVDTRADLYSLGCLLYELLTGSPPFDEDQLRTMPFDRVCQTIRETDPAKPSSKLSHLTPEQLATLATRHRSGSHRLRKSLRGDLDHIVRRSLEKERKRRYQTAIELAHDVTRYLRNEAIIDGHPSAAYRLQKFARRHTGSLLATGAVIGALLVGTAVSWLQAKRAVSAERAAIHHAAEKGREAEKAQRVLRLVQRMFSSANPHRDTIHDPDVTVRELLDEFSSDLLLWNELADEPETEAALRETIGEAYLGLREWDQAEFQLDAALRLRRNHLGPDHRETLRGAARLATVYYRQHLDWGRDTLTKAERLLLSTLATQRRLFGESDADTLRSWSQSLILPGSHPNRRLRTAQRIYEAQCGILGPTAPDTLATLATMADFLIDDSRFLEALERLRTLRDFQLDTLPPDHPSALVSGARIGTCLHRLGRYSEAIAQFREIVPLQATQLGPEHPDTLAAFDGLLQVSREWARELASPGPALERLASPSAEPLDGPSSDEVAATIAPLTGQSLHPSGSRWMVHRDGALHYTRWKIGELGGTSDWIETTAPLGFGDDGVDSVSKRPGQITYRCVCSFQVRTIPPSSALLLKMMRDDGVVLFLNGSELLRENVRPGPLKETTPSIYSVTGLGESIWHSFALPAHLLKPNSQNFLAAEVRQHRENSSDLRFDLELHLIPLTPRFTWPEEAKAEVLARLDALATDDPASNWGSRLRAALQCKDSNDPQIASNPEYWLDRSYIDCFAGERVLALRSLDNGLKCFPPDQSASPPPLFRTLLRRKVQLLDHLGRSEERRETAAAATRFESHHRQSLDLTAYYNAFPHDPSTWHGEAGLALRGVADSVRSEFGQAYQIGGILQLDSGIYPPDPDTPRFLQNEDINSLFSKDFPDQARGLRLNRRVTSFYLLGGCVWELASPGVPVAHLDIHYADKSEARLDLCAGRHLAEWAARSNLPDAKIAWTGEESHVIYEVMLDNPHPAKTVTTIDLVSAKTSAAPFFLAVTVE